MSYCVLVAAAMVAVTFSCHFQQRAFLPHPRPRIKLVVSLRRAGLSTRHTTLVEDSRKFAQYELMYSTKLSKEKIETFKYFRNNS